MRYTMSIEPVIDWFDTHQWPISEALIPSELPHQFLGSIELEPADRVRGGATAVSRLVRWPGRATGAAEGCGGWPVGSGEAVPRSSPLVSLCGRCFVCWPPLLALAVRARCLVCLGCRSRPCGCTDGWCRSEDHRTSAPAGSRPDMPKSASRSGRGRSGGCWRG